MANLNKTFESFIAEDSNFVVPKVGPMDGQPSADDVDLAPYEINNPEFLNRLNAYLAALTTRPYINPYAAFNHLKNKLTVTGLDFKIPTLVGEMGTHSEPLLQYGNKTHHEMQFAWVCVKGWYTLSAEIIPSMENPASPIAEDGLSEAAKAPAGSGWGFKKGDARMGKKTRQKDTKLAATLRQHNYALKSSLGDGSRVYTHSQGHAVHIHLHALKGATFSTYAPNSKLTGKGTSIAALRKHLATVHGRISDHKHSKGGFKNTR